MIDIIFYLFLAAILWLLPIFVGMSIGSAKKMGEGISALICIFLGWIGVLIVYLSSDSNDRS